MLLRWRHNQTLALRGLCLLFASTLMGCDSGKNALGQGNCDGSCADAQSFLTVADVQQVISQAVQEAQARNVTASIAVVDRVGNVLAAYAMTEQNPDPKFPLKMVIASGRDVKGGLEQLDIIPAPVGALAKAVTGAYLSSEGNAFSTRTASQIVQEHFNPGELNQPGGPLFGVQFSQLPCSDLNTRQSDGSVGPKRSPLGLSADPGGFPLYKNGTVVGGVGVISDQRYSLDLNITSGRDFDQDEIIALAATVGFDAPLERRGDRITVDGKTFRFSDVDTAQLLSNPAQAAGFDSLQNVGSLFAIRGYYAGTAVLAGTAFGQPASGIRQNPITFNGLDAFVLVDENNKERFPPKAGTENMAGFTPLTEQEVTTVLQEALKVANRARGQIRRPLGSAARVSISVVDTQGQILGIVRGRDAPIFGLDVSLQKARTATFFSSATAAAALNAAPDAEYVTRLQGDEAFLPTVTETIRLGQYVDDVRTFLDEPNALADGAFAFADRSGGNLSRPFYPDGIDANPPGPLSKPIAQWSPFSVGLQLDLVFNALVNHVAFVLGVLPNDPPNICAGYDGALGAMQTDTPIQQLANGIQIFPGSVPIYRDDVLVGGIGVSGDGIDQDDMISFLGLHNAGVKLGSIGNAPVDMRADQLAPQGVRLRYVNCPNKPFLDSDEQNVCQNK